MVSNDAHAWIQCNSVTYPVRRNSTLRIGRSIDSDLRLFQDVAVSRDHCTVVSAGDQLQVVELGSRNGTKVNGREISGAVVLRHRYVVQVGESELLILFELEEDLPTTEADVPLV